MLAPPPRFVPRPPSSSLPPPESLAEKDAALEKLEVLYSKKLEALKLASDCMAADGDPGQASAGDTRAQLSTPLMDHGDPNVDEDDIEETDDEIGALDDDNSAVDDGELSFEGDS